MAIRAASQWGVLDVAELRECGLSDAAIARRRRRGTLHRIHPGVYSVNAPPLSMHARFLAATKATDGVLSHYSAAILWRLVALRPRRSGPRHGHQRAHTRNVPGVVVHRTRRDPQVIRLDAIPVTTPARALIDLSSMQSFTPLRRAVREGFALKRVTLDELRGQTKTPRRSPRPGLRPHRIRTRGRHPRPHPRPLRATPGPTHPDPRRHPHPPRLPLAGPQPHDRSRRRPVPRHAHRPSGRRRQTGPPRGPRRPRHPRDLGSGHDATRPDRHENPNGGRAP